MPCTVDRVALLKILLHSAKYPSSAINGLLLGTASGADDTGSVNVVDAVPLFHSFLTLAPALETALLQVDAQCKGQQGLQVVGYYHANESLKDTELKPFARRIADRIQQRCPQAVVLLVDNTKLAAFAGRQSTEVLQLWEREGRSWGRAQQGRLKCDAAGAAEEYIELLLQGRHTQLADFDDHLNDVAKDWSNKALV